MTSAPNIEYEAFLVNYSPELFNLLSRGYFPVELPPTFQTTSFATAVTSTTNPIPTSFLHVPRAHTSRHEIPSLGLRRRITGLPNPTLFVQLCNYIVGRWTEINQHCQTSTLSRSKPIFNSSPDGRAIIRQYMQNELDEEILRIRATSNYLLNIDISRFYGSIYTHSIPWALHTKAAAKLDRSPTLFGNKLDILVRNNQDQQTMGIPIGPDTSLVISEIILTDFDNRLVQKHGQLRGIRYVDDLEIGFQSYAEAEHVLGTIRSLLAEYELELNPRKTLINKLPLPLHPEWISALRDHRFREKAFPQKFDILAYCDKAISFANRYPEDHVLKYALARLNDITIEPENLHIFESFLFQCISAESNTLSLALELLRKFYDQGNTVSISDLSEAMNTEIIVRGKLNHGNEITWALWALIYWRQNISDQAALVLSDITDPLVAISALHAQSEGLMSPMLYTTNWQTFMNDKELYDRNWFLAYESNLKEWPQKYGDYISSDNNFGFLKANNVQFYDVSRLAYPLRNTLQTDVYDI